MIPPHELDRLLRQMPGVVLVLGEFRENLGGEYFPVPAEDLVSARALPDVAGSRQAQGFRKGRSLPGQGFQHAAADIDVEGALAPAAAGSE